MPDPTDPRAVADDPSGIVQQMPEVTTEALEGLMDPTLCCFCGRDPYHYVDVGVGMVAAAVECCDPGIGLYQYGDEKLSEVSGRMRSMASELIARRATEADLRAEVERLTRQLGQANAVGRAKGWEESAAFLEGAKGVNDDGSEYDLSPSEFAAFALSGVRSFADAIAVLSPETDGGQDG